MKKGRIVFWVIALAIIAAAAILVPLSRRGEKLDEYAQETRQEFIARLAATPLYAEQGNADYLNYLAIAAHEQAWSAHHRLEPVASGPPEVRIDVPAYEEAMLRRMIEIARAEDATGIADRLARLVNEWFEVE